MKVACALSQDIAYDSEFCGKHSVFVDIQINISGACGLQNNRIITLTLLMKCIMTRTNNISDH